MTSHRAKYLWILALCPLIMGGWGTDRIWRTAASPTIVGGGITFGSNTYPEPSGTTVTVMENGSIDMLAHSDDTDILSISGVDQSPSSDTCSVDWSATNGGSFSNTRTVSGELTTFTAPSVPSGQDYVIVNINAAPDDRSTSNPGNIPSGDSGNRNDSPNAAGAVQLQVKVIKACPNALNVIQNCTPFTFAWWHGAPNNKMSAGMMGAEIAVAGPGGPNPAPGDWNGLLIKEKLAVNAAGTNYVNGDFINVPGATPAQICVGNATFKVGQGGNPIGACVAPATDNTIWDLHATVAVPDLMQVNGPVIVKCDQTYSCVGGPDISTTTITRTYNHVIFGGGNVKNATDVTITKP